MTSPGVSKLTEEVEELLELEVWGLEPSLALAQGAQEASK